MATLAFWVLFLAFLGAFAAQVTRRVQLIAATPNTFSLDNLGFRTTRFVVDVLLQWRTIKERPFTGLMHAFVFWGFVAFGGYTVTEFLYGLGIVDLTHAGWFHAYRLVLTPFATAVLVGIVYLLIRRAFVRPVALGTKVSVESIVIALFIATLMITFLLAFRLEEGTAAERVNWWIHMTVILAFMALIPASKHLHLVLSPITVFLKSTELGNLPNLDFEKEQVGLETVKDLGSKSVLDAFTCVECGRCQVNCPAWGAGKALNPKTIILQTQGALLGDKDKKLVDVYSADVLWQCTTCGACENQCPVGIEHLPILIGSRRGLTSNGEAPEYLGAMYNNLERRSNIWGLGYDQRTKFVTSAELETFDPAKHDVMVWLGCAGSFDADFQKSLKSMFAILRTCGVKFGVLSKEKCNGDPAKRTGNEYMFQELANANIADLKAAGPKKILTSCPHCVKTIGEDYRKFGYEVEIVHSSVYIEELTREKTAADVSKDKVTFHDPCYLGRYAGKVDEPRALLERFGADISEVERNRENPYCCGAGGGLLFNDKEEEQGTRISDVRFKQLQATGATTVVTACPFCSIMLKGAGASAQSDTQFVDLMTYVNGKLQPRA
jgi:Fe-S oxidoreductase